MKLDTILSKNNKNHHKDSTYAKIPDKNWYANMCFDQEL